MSQGAPSPTPLDLPLDGGGTVLVEASAGTGKTHALTTLVARLVVEEGRRPDEILVVTFTRAATAELRERIRRTLKAAREAVQAEMEQRSVGPEPQARELLARWTGPSGVDLGQSARRLDAALQDIDHASVYTIHGFCQRVLGDLAFEGGFPFGFEVSGDDQESTARAVRDFWRQRLYDASAVLVRYAVDQKFLPDPLAQWTRAGRTKPGLHIVGAQAPQPPRETCEAEWRSAFEATRARWDEHGEAFRREMLEGAWLNRNKYRKDSVEKRLGPVERSFAAPEPRLWEKDAASWFGREKVSRACKKNATMPDNPLFDDFDRLAEASRALREAFDAWLRCARAELIAEVRAAARRRVREERRLRYDDLTIEVETALDAPGGARLAASIRRAHPCALIDEFQDTDQVQARIFSRVYGPAEGVRDGAPAVPGTLFVVGDPKQSIYRFRGADIFAYLGTRRRAGRILPLERNWRSAPGLVAAVNEMFSVPLPFVLPEIGYRPVRAARDAEDTSRIPPDLEREPFVLRLFPPGADDRIWNKGEANRIAVATAASEIVGLLEGEPNNAGGRAAGEADPNGEGLRGSDIAVLVRTRAQGHLVAKALRERGIRAAETSDESVFESREAEQLARLLHCLAEPAPETELRGALAGDLFALDTADLRAMDEDDEVWSAWRERLHAWKQCWETRGIGALLLLLLEREGGATRLLRLRDGARRLTNYRHLAELLLDVETGSRLTPAALAAWLGRQRQTANRGRDESVLLRLDSDEQLVRILTVHGSKGLEFPIVFCPFAWDAPDPGRRSGDADVAYHESAGDTYREVLDLDPDEAARRGARIEEFSESLRLLYVALTRAKHRCVVTWGKIKDAEHAPLAWLLHRGPGADAALESIAGDGESEGLARSPSRGPAAEGVGTREREQEEADTARGRGDGALGEKAEPPEDEGRATLEASPEIADALDAAVRHFQGLDWSEWRDEVQAFAARGPDAVSVSVIEPGESRRVAAHTRPLPALEARSATRPLRRIRQMTSYSALAAEGARATHASAYALVERPDHDAGDAPSYRAGQEGGASLESGVVRNAFTFPRGAAAGSCLHGIFERLDRIPPGGSVPDLDALCRDALQDFGFEDRWRPVVRTLVEHARAVRLHEPREPEHESTSPDPSSTPRAGAQPAHGDDPGDGSHPHPARGAGAPLAGAPRTSGEAPGAGPAHGFRLADPVRRIAEMEFHFPVSGLVRSRLAARLSEYGYPHPFEDDGQNTEAGERPPIDGFLRGFVDLVVEHAGRWYIIDYKSNWLGPDAASYVPAALRRATFASGYPLQYLIYLVALHRHLGARLPDYDYERHVGGAFYLYLRGIDPTAGMSRGVYFDRPSRACIQALDTCFQGEHAR